MLSRAPWRNERSLSSPAHCVLYQHDPALFRPPRCWHHFGSNSGCVREISHGPQAEQARKSGPRPTGPPWPLAIFRSPSA